MYVLNSNPFITLNNVKREGWKQIKNFLKEKSVGGG